MRAVVLTEYGDPDVLTLTEIPAPSYGPDDVLVNVRATALNRADLLQRRGLYPGPATEHEVPGMEFAGTVAAIGSAVGEWRVGDEVMGIVSGGAYAEQLAVNQRQLMPIPSSVGISDAATVPEVFLTAFDAMVVQGGLTSGRWALVHAGGSGVGTAAIQIAKAMGARIAVTASAGKVQRCLDLGADAAIDYRAESFLDRVGDLTNSRGADVVIDVIGGEYTIDNIKALRVGGRLIQVGVMGKQTVELPLGMLLPKRASLIGTVLRARPLEEKAVLTQRATAELLPLFDQGLLKPIVDSRYDLADIASAQAYMESNANFGKILVDVS